MFYRIIRTRMGATRICRGSPLPYGGSSAPAWVRLITQLSNPRCQKVSGQRYQNLPYLDKCCKGPNL